MTTVVRHAASLVRDALGDTRIVAVQGARQVGKTTLVSEIAQQLGGLVVTFDDAEVRALAAADPLSFLNQFPDALLAIDEVQRVPSLMLALKLVVDRDPRPGRFLVTGSANLLRIPAIEDSLAGRVEGVELHGFSQGELAGHRERFVDRLLAGDRFIGHTSALSRHDYLERVVAGTYPEALQRQAGRRRDQWLDNYLTRIVERDAPDVSTSQRLSDLPRILQLLAARNSEELNVASLAGASGIPVRSLAPLLDLLETLYLIQRVPAWSTNLSKRVVSRPKVMLLDGGLTARLVNVSAAGAAPGINAEIAGHLLEGFVAGELRRQLSWAEESIRMYHYRDHDGPEIDLILETPDGRVAGIEVKAAATAAARDVRWLAKLRDSLGARFVAGVVLHTGSRGGSLGDRLTALPMDILWTA